VFHKQEQGVLCLLMCYEGSNGLSRGLICVKAEFRCKYGLTKVSKIQIQIQNATCVPTKRIFVGVEKQGFACLWHDISAI